MDILAICNKNSLFYWLIKMFKYAGLVVKTAIFLGFLLQAFNTEVYSHFPLPP
jgi:hypothetical protein